MSKKVVITVIALVAALVVSIGGAVLLHNHLAKAPSNQLVAPNSSQQDSEDTGNDADSDEDENPKAPEISFTDSEGKPVKLSDFTDKPIVLNIWASWCGPCKSEMPDFEKAYKKYDKDINFVMLNATDSQRETVDSALEFVKKEGFKFPVYFDTEQDAVFKLGVRGFPSTFFIDTDGKIVAGAEGMLDAENLEKGINMLLGNS